jgi:hypothetical protein
MLKNPFQHRAHALFPATETKSVQNINKIGLVIFRVGNKHLCFTTSPLTDAISVTFLVYIIMNTNKAKSEIFFAQQKNDDNTTVIVS